MNNKKRINSKCLNFLNYCYHANKLNGNSYNLVIMKRSKKNNNLIHWNFIFILQFELFVNEKT